MATGGRRATSARLSDMSREQERRPRPSRLPRRAERPTIPDDRRTAAGRTDRARTRTGPPAHRAAPRTRIRSFPRRGGRCRKSSPEDATHQGRSLAWRTTTSRDSPSCSICRRTSSPMAWRRRAACSSPGVRTPDHRLRDPTAARGPPRAGFRAVAATGAGCRARRARPSPPRPTPRRCCAGSPR
jgi:hypothetical protein